MANRLKQILLHIAHLPASDQRWILRRLGHSELKTFKKWQGFSLLQNAQRFRALKIRSLSFEPSLALPAYCEQLATQAPLYVAIVIEQGSFPWQTLFLQQFDKDGDVSAILKNQVIDIKLPVKQALFSMWEKTLSFEDHLGSTHG